MGKTQPKAIFAHCCFQRLEIGVRACSILHHTGKPNGFKALVQGVDSFGIFSIPMATNNRHTVKLTNATLKL